MLRHSNCGWIAVRDLQEMIVAQENITLLTQLGEGNFGAVYEASAVGLPGMPRRHPMQVAVKVVQGADAETVREAWRMYSLRHSNVVAVLGVCVDPVMIVSELMEDGDLKGYLGSMRGLGLNVTERIGIGIQACRGVAHLHRHRVVHRDIAARNVLVSAARQAVKLSDFGAYGWLSDLQSADCVMLIGQGWRGACTAAR